MITPKIDVTAWANHVYRWVARPKDKFEGYTRKGKFKKASNMNFALNTSIKVEKVLQEYVAQATGAEKGQGCWIDAHEEDLLYQRALNQVMKDDPRVRGGGNIRVGEIVLIVDSDTEVVSSSRIPIFKLPLLTILACRLSLVRSCRDVSFSRAGYYSAFDRRHASSARLLRKRHHLLH